MAVKRYFQLGRVFSAMLTAGIAIVGAYSTGYELTLVQFLAFMVMGFTGHAFGGTMNEIIDLELDSMVPELKDKPLVSGDISVNAAYAYALALLFTGYIVMGFVFPSWDAMLLFTISHIAAWYYAYRGKYAPYQFELSLGWLFGFWAIFGAVAVAHTITPWTLVTAGAIFVFAVFINYGNAMKDVETDRLLKVPTRAVAWRYEHRNVLDWHDRNARYGAWIKFFLLAFFFIPILFHYMDWGYFQLQRTFMGIPVYLLAFLLVVLPTQLWVMKMIPGRHGRKYWTRFIVKDLMVTWLAFSLIIIDLVGIGLSLFIFFLPFIWFAGSTLLLYGRFMRVGL